MTLMDGVFEVTSGRSTSGGWWSECPICKETMIRATEFGMDQAFLGHMNDKHHFNDPEINVPKIGHA